MRNKDILVEVYKRCPHFFFDYTDYHKVLFNELKNEEYFEYTDYAIWLTTMGLLETLKLVDESYSE